MAELPPPPPRSPRGPLPLCRPKPEVLITVTGGAQDFKLSSQLQVAFDRGLVSAAQSARAWIFTAGSDTGV